MSNSRIFCVTFAVVSGAMALSQMLGIESRYTGIEQVVGKFVMCVSFGFFSVALLGDREGAA